MSTSNNLILKKHGINSAYTFKGLIKEADSIRMEYTFFHVIPIILSVVMLGFSKEWTFVVTQIMSCFIVCCCVVSLIYRERYKKVDGYIDLANAVKIFYDRVESMYLSSTYNDIDSLENEYANLIKKTNKYPISIMGRTWSKFRIRKEMNLNWLS